MESISHSIGTEKPGWLGWIEVSTYSNLLKMPEIRRERLFWEMYWIIAGGHTLLYVKADAIQDSSSGILTVGLRNFNCYNTPSRHALEASACSPSGISSPFTTIFTFLNAIYQRLLQGVSPKHGRVLIYVWAIEQDELSKRIIPQGERNETRTGQDVVVPWVLSKSNIAQNPKSPRDSREEVYNRYYHISAKGELSALVSQAAAGLGLTIGSVVGQPSSTQGVEILQDGWERSNYYVELRRWSI